MQQLQPEQVVCKRHLKKDNRHVCGWVAFRDRCVSYSGPSGTSRPVGGRPCVAAAALAQERPPGVRRPQPRTWTESEPCDGPAGSGLGPEADGAFLYQPRSARRATPARAWFPHLSRFFRRPDFGAQVSSVGGCWYENRRMSNDQRPLTNGRIPCRGSGVLWRLCPAPTGDPACMRLAATP
jgi:hypothetical protein